MSFLLVTTVKVSLVVAAGLAVAALLGKRSAAARHSVLAAAVVCALLMPALEPIVPEWALPPWPGAAAVIREQPAAGSLANATEAVAESRAGGSFTAGGETVAFSSAATGSALPRSIAAAWLAGAGLSLFVLVVGLARLTWLASRARPVAAGAWTRQAQAIGRELSLGREVQLLESDHPSLLVTWGLFVPKVILPRTARSWSEERAAIVLRHELAHIRRGDWVLQLAGELLRTAFWFNPLVWIACARLRQESEQACDDEVLSSGVAGPDYAAHLVELARLLKSEAAPRLPAPAIARSSSLERRVRAMLNDHLIRTPATRVARFMIAGALLTFTVALAAAQTALVTFSGSVFDPTGKPVPGVAVVLTNTQSKAKFEVVSSDAGHFSFVPLPADTYALTASLPGFKKAEDSVTLTGKTVKRDVTLSLGELQETISVRASRSVDETEIVANKIVRVTGAKPDTAVSRSSYQQALDSCTPSTTGGRVRPPRKLKDVKPIYPANLRESQTAGKVLLKATIATDGTVRDAQVVKSIHPDLDNAAVEAVRQWLFDGTLLNCAPTEVTMNVSVDFGIQ